MCHFTLNNEAIFNSYKNISKLEEKTYLFNKKFCIYKLNSLYCRKQ